MTGTECLICPPNQEGARGIIPLAITRPQLTAPEDLTLLIVSGIRISEDLLYYIS